MGRLSNSPDVDVSSVVQGRWVRGGSVVSVEEQAATSASCQPAAVPCVPRLRIHQRPR
jgi:hypothetical protein